MRKNLQMFRLGKDLTQEGMAKAIGVSRTAYNNIESGKSKGSMRFWLKLKEKFPEIDIETMVKEREDETQAKNHSE